MAMARAVPVNVAEKGKDMSDEVKGWYDAVLMTWDGREVIISQHPSYEKAKEQAEQIMVRERDFHPYALRVRIVPTKRLDYWPPPSAKKGSERRPSNVDAKKRGGGPPLGSLPNFNYDASTWRITCEFEAQEWDDSTLHTFKAGEVYRVEYQGANIWSLPDLRKRFRLTDKQLSNIEPLE